MKKSFPIFHKFFFALLASLMVLSFSACGRGGDKVVNVYNWGQYIDPQVLKDFEKETGIHVIYSTYTTNEDLYMKLNNGGTVYDLVCPSSFMLDKLKTEGFLQKIDYSKIPNMKYIDKEYLYTNSDPKQEYSVPYFWGTVGILYNKKKVEDPVDSWDIIWNPKYKRQIVMIDSLRDALGLALSRRGFSENSRDLKELAIVKKDLIDQYPLVYAYLVEQTRDLMINGESALSVVFSGDAAAAMARNKDLDFVVPKEGSNLWIDSFAIPVTATHKENAEAFINFMCQPEVMVKNAQYVGYSLPSSAGKALLTKEEQENTAAYPDKSVYDRLEVFKNVGDFVRVYNDLWQEVKNQ